MQINDVMFIAEDTDTRKKCAGLKTISRQHR